MNDIEYLVCPETKQSLRLLDKQLLAELNQKISGRKLKTDSGQEVEQKLENGLIRSDGKVIYPIFAQIPILTKEEGILI